MSDVRPTHKRGLDSTDSTHLSNATGTADVASGNKPPKKRNKKKPKKPTSNVDVSETAAALPPASTEEDMAGLSQEEGPVAVSATIDTQDNDQPVADTIATKSTQQKKQKKKKAKNDGGDAKNKETAQAHHEDANPNTGEPSTSSPSKLDKVGRIGKMIQEGRDPPKRRPRGKRGGSQVRVKERTRRRQTLAYRVRKAKETLIILKELGRSLTDRELDEMQNREILKLVKGHRLTCGSNEVIHSFDVTEFASQWREKNGLSPTAPIFEDGAVTVQDLIKFGFQIYDRGQVYGYERDENGEMTLVFSAVFRPFATMEPELLDRFRWLAGWFVSLKSQLQPNLMNKAHQATGGIGVMLAQGWRAGMDAGKRFGWYANPRTDWLDDAKNHGVAAGLYDDLYKAQAPRDHAYARRLLQQHGLPSFGNASVAEETASTGSNLTITCGDFCNAVHQDNDASMFTFGIWFPTTSDGQLVMDDDDARSMVEGGHFFWADYGFAVDFGQFAGVVSLTWRGPKDRHATAKSSTKNGYLRWGTSIQIPRTLVTRVKRFQALGGEINDYYTRSKKAPPPGYINTLNLPRRQPKRSTSQAADSDVEDEDSDDYQDYSDEEDAEYDDLDDEDFVPYSEVESDD